MNWHGYRGTFDAVLVYSNFESSICLSVNLCHFVDRIGTVDDLRSSGLYLSDLNMHDGSQCLTMQGTQRLSEIEFACDRVSYYMPRLSFFNPVSSSLHPASSAQ